MHKGNSNWNDASCTDTKASVCEDGSPFYTLPSNSPPCPPEVLALDVTSRPAEYQYQCSCNPYSCTEDDIEVCPLADRIWTAAECELAATALGLADITMQTPEQHTYPPQGCSYSGPVKIPQTAALQTWGLIFSAQIKAGGWMPTIPYPELYLPVCKTAAGRDGSSLCSKVAQGYMPKVSARTQIFFESYTAGPAAPSYDSIDDCYAAAAASGQCYVDSYEGVAYSGPTGILISYLTRYDVPIGGGVYHDTYTCYCGTEPWSLAATATANFDLVQASYGSLYSWPTYVCGGPSPPPPPPPYACSANEQCTDLINGATVTGDASAAKDLCEATPGCVAYDYDSDTQLGHACATVTAAPVQLSTRTLCVKPGPLRRDAGSRPNISPAPSPGLSPPRPLTQALPRSLLPLSPPGHATYHGSCAAGVYGERAIVGGDHDGKRAAPTRAYDECVDPTTPTREHAETPPASGVAPPQPSLSDGTPSTRASVPAARAISFSPTPSASRSPPIPTRLQPASLGSSVARTTRQVAARSKRRPRRTARSRWS